MQSPTDGAGRQLKGVYESRKKLPTFGHRDREADELFPQGGFLQACFPVYRGSLHQVNA